MNKKLKIKQKIITIFILLIAIFCCVFILHTHSFRSKTDITKADNTTAIHSNTPLQPQKAIDTYQLMSDEQVEKIYQSFLEAKSVNSDIVAYIEFNNKLISQPIAQSTDNVKYLYKNWENMSYRIYGTAFLDFRNVLDEKDMNTIIYGHYLSTKNDPERALMFTPLAQLRDEKNYEKNRSLVLVTEKDIRYYELSMVYDCQLVQDGEYDYPPDDLIFNEINYPEDLLKTYLTNAEKKQFYKTKEKILENDRFLTLQTCVDRRSDSRQLVVFKEVFKKPLPTEWLTKKQS